MKAHTIYVFLPVKPAANTAQDIEITLNPQNHGSISFSRLRCFRDSVTGHEKKTSRLQLGHSHMNSTWNVDLARERREAGYPLPRDNHYAQA